MQIPAVHVRRPEWPEWSTACGSHLKAREGVLTTAKPVGVTCRHIACQNLAAELAAEARPRRRRKK